LRGGEFAAETLIPAAWWHIAMDRSVLSQDSLAFLMERGDLRVKATNARAPDFIVTIEIGFGLLDAVDIDHAAILLLFARSASIRWYSRRMASNSRSDGAGS
jgi:hypothetical protein